MRRQKSAAKLQAEVVRFNAAHPVGTPVEYRSHPTAEPLRTRTRSEAWVLSGHTPVVLIHNVGGSVALDAVKPFDPTGREA